MNKESVAAQRDAVDFGEALGRKYPKEADYIMNIVGQEVAAQQMKVARRYDKAYERLHGMTQEESMEVDRIKREEIMEELRKKRRGE